MNTYVEIQIRSMVGDKTLLWMASEDRFRQILMKQGGGIVEDLSAAVKRGDGS